MDSECNHLHVPAIVLGDAGLLALCVKTHYVASSLARCHSDAKIGEANFPEIDTKLYT